MNVRFDSVFFFFFRSLLSRLTFYLINVRKYNFYVEWIVIDFVVWNKLMIEFLMRPKSWRKKKEEEKK